MNGYGKVAWNEYAMAHQSCTPSLMLELNSSVAAEMRGDVVDCGCGTAKVTPFVFDNPQVHSYTGIDFSDVMVNRANWMLSQFPKCSGRIIHGSIEESLDRQYDSGMSINSYYSWPDPMRILSTISRSIKEGGTFVLVTPNQSINMPKLLDYCRNELIAHPYYQAFKSMNLAFCENADARFVQMDQLISEVKEVGFLVEEAHQRLYLGGLNFLKLTK